MSLIFVTGDHPRHAFIARKLATTGYLSGIIREKRSAFIPTPPASLSDELKKLFEQHFALRAETEEGVFGHQEWPEVELLEVSLAELNATKTHTFIQKHQPKLLLSYGCHKLNQDTLNLIQGDAWNIHGGLSPWYRGNTTHFWPSYLLEPQMTGMTVHQLTQQLDAGAVVHQCTAPMTRGDSLHRLAARAVETLAEELPELVRLQQQESPISLHHHKIAGKLWQTQDWQPEHLKVIYQLYNDRIVDAYLDGDLSQHQPQLHRQF